MTQGKESGISKLLPAGPLKGMVGPAEKGDSLHMAMPCNVLGDRKPETCRGIFLDIEITSSQHHGICCKPNSQQPTCLQILWRPGVFPYLPNFHPIWLLVP